MNNKPVLQYKLWIYNVNKRRCFWQLVHVLHGGMSKTVQIALIIKASSIDFKKKKTLEYTDSWRK